MPAGTTKSTKRLAPLAIRWKREFEGHIISLAWDPTGKSLAIGVVEGPVYILPVDGAEPIRLAGHRFGTTTVAWSADGSYLASGGQDGRVRIWKPGQEEPRAEFEAGGSWVEQVAWNPLGGRKGTPHLLATGAGRALRLWDAEGKALLAYEDHPSTIADLVWKPASQLITTASYSRLAIFSTVLRQAQRDFAWKGSILRIAWSPNGKFVATGDQDSTVHFWFDKTGRDLQMWGYPTKVRELAWDPTSRYLATGGGFDVTIWDCLKSPEGTKPILLKGHEQFLSALCYQHRGRLLASGCQGGEVRVWLPAESRQARAGISINDGITQLAWSPDDQLLAMGTETGGVVLFDAPSLSSPTAA